MLRAEKCTKHAVFRQYRYTPIHTHKINTMYTLRGRAMSKNLTLAYMLVSSSNRQTFPILTFATGKMKTLGFVARMELVNIVILRHKWVFVNDQLAVKMT